MCVCSSSSSSSSSSSTCWCCCWWWWWCCNQTDFVVFAVAALGNKSCGISCGKTWSISCQFVIFISFFFIFLAKIIIFYFLILFSFFLPCLVDTDWHDLPSWIRTHSKAVKIKEKKEKFDTPTYKGWLKNFICRKKKMKKFVFFFKKRRFLRFCTHCVVSKVVDIWHPKW